GSLSVRSPRARGHRLNHAPPSRPSGRGFNWTPYGLKAKQRRSLSPEGDENKAPGRWLRARGAGAPCASRGGERSLRLPKATYLLLADPPSAGSTCRVGRGWHAWRAVQSETCVPPAA